MHELRALVVFSVVLLALMYGLFFAGQWAPVPGLGFIFVSMGLVFGWVSYRLNVRLRSTDPADVGLRILLNEFRWLFIFGPKFTPQSEHPFKNIPPERATSSAVR